ncbi:phosphoribosylformylglycinamidine synthase subunit PurS [Caldalkalibacillus salinus]|uniref:phosphoribosylformylglycinamidine synthase subunit PurS n=1 Tax=Caldalkalibacillus salinus TaxID=2803787 RepID=UPI001922FBE9|nr:phosphoribosylformylglycinamidine synthase subunit PurS [Caldalkalibacillus salinus]
MFKVMVHVTLKESVLDPQGSAVKKSLHTMQYEEVQDVRIGKYMELDIQADSEQAARARVTEMCEKLLSNPVIEDYEIQIQECPQQVTGG